MDFYTRRRAFLLIEEKANLQDTKDEFFKKISFLQQQYKCGYDAIKNHPQINQDYMYGALFLFDLGVKQLEAIKFLVRGGDFEWLLLRSFVIPTTPVYILGETIFESSILQTDIMGRMTSTFFFKLNQFGIVSSDTWFKLAMLRSCRSLLGIAHINDYSFYSERDIIQPPASFKKYENELEQVKKDFYGFIGQPFELRKFEKAFWFFLQDLLKRGNLNDVIKAFSYNKYDYQNFSTKKQSLPDDQLKELLDCLKDFNTFKSLHIMGCEFQLIDSKDLYRLCLELFLYFLNQKGSVFDPENKIYTQRGESDRILHATAFLDLIRFLLINKINIASSWTGDMEKNFENLVKIELSILLDKDIVQRIKVVDFVTTENLTSNMRDITQLSIYRKNYSKYFSEYFSAFFKTGDNPRSFRSRR